MAIYNNNVIKHGFQLSKGSIDSVKTFLRRETDKAKPTQRSQVLLRYHALQDKTEPVKTGISSLLSSANGYDYYLVDNYPELPVVYHYRYSKPDVADLGLEITYRLKVIPGQEAAVVSLLAKRKNPEKELHDTLESWTKTAFADLEKMALENHEAFKVEMNKKLEAQGRMHGLQLTTQINYQFEGLPPNPRIVVDARDIKVQPREYTKFTTLSFYAVLKPDPAEHQSSYSHIWYQQRAVFKPLLTGLLEAYISHQVTYNTLIDDLQETVRKGLIKYWNDALRLERKGWLLEELQLSTTEAPPSIHESKEIVTNIILNKAKISLNNAVILNRVNADLFTRSGITDLRQWVTDKLQQVSQNILAQFSYAELISRFTELSNLIKSELNREAGRIGYTVEYLTTDDLISPDKLNFSVELEAEEQEFRTATNDTVKVNVLVNGKIKSLNHETWRQLLKPGAVQNFGNEMKPELLRYLRQALLRIDPAEFYTTFTAVHSPAIVNDLRKILVNKFNLESVDIVPTLEDTEAAKLLRDLRNGFFTSQIELFRKSAGFMIRYSISGVGVYKWSLFSSRNVADKQAIIDNLSSMVANYVRYNIELQVNQINWLQHPRFVSLVLAVAKSSVEHISESTGLLIEVLDVSEKYNHVTNDLVQLNVKNSRDYLLNIAERISQVNNRLLDQVGLDLPDPDEIKRLEEMKAGLEKRMKEEKFSANDLSISHGTGIDKLIGDINQGKLLRAPDDADTGKPNSKKDDDKDDDDNLQATIIS